MPPPRKMQALMFLLMAVTLALSLAAPAITPSAAASPAAAPNDTLTDEPPPAIVINEILYDPHPDQPPADPNGDANGDGIRDGSQDEFVELYNNTGGPLDVSGWTISDAVAVRHTFPAATVIPADCAIVVFGGGTPTGDFGSVVVQTASTGFLGLNNGGDTVTINDGVGDVATYTYGSEGVSDQSLTRDPDIFGPEPLVGHTVAAGSPNSVHSPGTMIDGTPFTGCVVPTPRVVINEFAPKGTEWIELYNAGTASQDLAGWTLADDGGSEPLAGVLDPGAYQVIITTLNLDNAGDFIELHSPDPPEAVVDRVAYGDTGGAPNAPFASDAAQYSTARIVDGLDTDDDARDWNMDPTPTQGAANDVADNNLGGSLLINEVDVFPDAGNDMIELFNPGGAPVDVTSWLISDGDDVAILNGSLSVPAGGFLALEEGVDWTTEGTTGVDFSSSDVAYLFEPSRVRVDQLGWAGEFLDGCVARVPDGAGPNVGFDWVSSGGDVTLFDQDCTMGSSNGSGPAPPLVFNELQADPDAINGDANGDGVVSTTEDEFVEIVNDSGAPVDISGWILSDGVQLRHTFPAGTVIPNLCTVVVFGGGTPTGSFGGAVVQIASTGGLGLNNSGDTVTLNDGSNDIVSLIYGSEGGNNQSITRDPDITGPEPLVYHSTATGSGSALFSPGTMIDGTPFVGCGSQCGAPATKIHEVQGPGASSPMPGATVWIEAVVVGDFQDTATELGGFFVQEEDIDADLDPMTSEGIFVYDDGFGVDVAMGDPVRVLGVVRENSGETQLFTISDVLFCPNGLPVTPAAIILPVTTLDEWEWSEGMGIVFGQTLAASGHYNQGYRGQVDLSLDVPLQIPTNITDPGAPANGLQDLNDRSRIMLDDGSEVTNPMPLPPYLGLDNTLRQGDTVQGLAGALGYSSGAYKVQPTASVTFSRINDRLPPPDVGGTLTIANLNVLNFFTTLDTGPDICGPGQDQGCRGADNAFEFPRQLDKLAAALAILDADVVGLNELENTTGAPVLQTLVDGINAVAGPGTYTYIDPGVILGGDHVIKVGLIYKAGTVTPTGPFALLDSAVDPNFNDARNRPALAQTFEQNSTGSQVTVVVNHLKSKGCSDATGLDADQGDGQACWNYTRTQGVLSEIAWMAGNPTGMGGSDFLVIGDMNAYAMEDPIQALVDSSFADLIDAYQGPGAYSYTYRGESGRLDHAFASPSLLPQVTGTAVWHINADEPRGLDYNDWNQPALYVPDQWRASDHDAVVVGLDLEPAASLVCNGPVVGFEDGAFPDDWSYTTLALPGGEWVVSMDNSSGSWDPGPAPEGQYYASANDDLPGSGNDGSADYLYTNIIDLSGAATASLDFMYHFNAAFGHIAGGVEVSGDGGGTWDGEIVVPAGDVWQPYNLDLNAYAGNPNVQIRFHSDDGGSWAAGYAVDAVFLACDAGGPPNIYVDPLFIGSTQPTNSVVVESMTISNTGGGMLDWLIEEEDLGMPMLPLATGRRVATTEDAALKSMLQQVTIGDLGFSAAGEGAGVRVPQTPSSPEGLTTITHSLTQNIVSGNSVSCNNGVGHTDNSYLRVFDLESFGIFDAFDVTQVEFGVEVATSATGGQPLSVNLYTMIDPLAPLTFGNLALIGSSPDTVPDQSLTLYTVPVAGAAPAGSVLVVEVFTPDGQTAGNSFFIGSNPDGQTAPSYLAAAACGVPEPTDTAAIGFPGMHIVMNVTGDTVAGGACTAPSDIPWLTVAPDNGSNAGGTDTPVDVTFDSTGLANGVYLGNLCVTSNDPDPGPGNETELVIVPVELTVRPPTAVTLSGLAAGEAQSPLPVSLPLTALPALAGAALAAAYVLRRR
ncbi:MAG: ExeM/NucH family extracellular endonuclease [Chloroflexota bacterium]|nr:ExeM/NucH family extracellular endonuclease [Chloroflexota bacterium]